MRSTASVTLPAYGGRVHLDLGVFVAASGGPLELRVTRPSYSAPPTAEQVNPATGATRPLAPALVTDWRGLRRFFDVEMRNRAGKLVVARQLPFCPGSGEPQRVDDSGPLTPSYPGGCGSGFPFVRGMIWGLDAGWATGAFGFGEEGGYGGPAAVVRLAPGRYTATVRIASPYDDLFAAPADARAVRVRVSVRRPRRGAPEGDVVRGEGFAMSPRVAHRPAVASAEVPTITDPDPATLPDLAALPAWSLHVERTRRREYIAFAASPWNAGSAPLVVEGFRRPGERVMDAYQYFLDADGRVTGRAPIGEMAYDARRGHDHWHFLQFVDYRLLDASGREVVRSKKQAYCLMPTDAVDLTIPGSDLRAGGFDLGSRCGSPRALWVRETLFAGWADTYFQSTPGQSLEITGVPNGRYRVVVHVNPLGKIVDRTAENDVATRVVRLRGRPGARRITVAPWNGVRD